MMRSLLNGERGRKHVMEWTTFSSFQRKSGPISSLSLCAIYRIVYVDDAAMRLPLSIYAATRTRAAEQNLSLASLRLAPLCAADMCLLNPTEQRRRPEKSLGVKMQVQDFRR